MTPLSCTSAEIVSSKRRYCGYRGNSIVDATWCRGVFIFTSIRYRTVHGQGTETRPQTRGAGERRRTQSAPRGHSRRFVRRRSLLRCEGSGSSALRDGASTSRRWRRNQRSFDQFRRLAANLLQGSAGASKGRIAWPAAEPTRSQGWAQDLCRGGRLRGRSEGCKAKADNLAVPQGDRDTVWHPSPSAKLGACA